jgi:hypothetical protein
LTAIRAQQSLSEQTVQYARVLLDTLQQSNEGSSRSSSILSDLEVTLKGIEIRFKNLSATPTPSVFPPASAVPLPASPISRSRSPSPSPSLIRSPVVEKATRPDPAVLRQRVLNTESYLRNRVSEDRQGDEAGLLPLKITRVKEQKGTGGRDDLLGGARPGMGSAQLHEELGGQLADVSPNDIDFACTQLMIDVASVEAECCTFRQLARGREIVT